MRFCQGIDPSRFCRGLITALIVLAPMLCWAGTDGWTSYGPEGGEVNVLVADPNTPGKVFAGLDFAGGLYASQDGGANWTRLLQGFSVTAIGVRPTSSNTIYAGTVGSGVFKTTDGGINWIQMNTGLSGLALQVAAIAIDPSAPDTVYIGTWSKGAFKSTDGGGHWAPVNVGLSDLYVLVLAIDPSTPGQLYAGTLRAGLFKTTNGGASWTPINEGVPSVPFYTETFAIAIDPLSSSTIYASFQGRGIYKSTDAGDHWTQASEGLTEWNVKGVAFSGTAIYAATASSGVFETVNGGSTWSARGSGLLGIALKCLLVDPLTAGKLYAGSYGGGVFSSSDAGGSWARANAGLLGAHVLAIALDSHVPSNLYAAVFGSGLAKSTDGGLHWSTSTSGITDLSLYSVAIDALTPSIVYTGSQNGHVFKSTDGGIHFTDTSFGLPLFPIEWLTADPQISGTVYASTWGGGLYKSTNGGATWALLWLGDGGASSTYRMLISPQSPTAFYICTASGHYFSIDAGAHWTLLNSPLGTSYVNSISFDALTPSILYIGGLSGAYKSVDGGTNWTFLALGATGSLTTLIADPVSPGMLYAGFASYGVSVSRDGGATWSWLNTGLNTSTVYDLAADSATPRTLHAGTSAGGVNSITLRCFPISIAPLPPLPSGMVGGHFSQLFSASLGTPPYTFSLIGALPPGVSFDSATHTISGAPQAVGNYPFAVEVMDANGCHSNQTYTLSVLCPSIALNPSTVPQLTAGVPMQSVVFSQSGGSGTITWSLQGNLPTGMSFLNGTLSGTPLQTGSFPMTITATDAQGCSGSRGYTLAIACPSITVGPEALPGATAGAAYPATTLVATGALGSVTWTVTGALPSGMTFSGGSLSGTPTRTGSFPLTITATDGNGCTASRAYTLSVACPTITLSPGSLAAGTVGAVYPTATFVPSAGVGPTLWSITGALPEGIAFANGTLSGTPTQKGTFPITVVATDANGCVASREYTLTIQCAAITVEPGALPGGTVGVSYSTTVFSQTGGIGAIDWTLTGSLPAGITLANGTLSGTPTQSGSFDVSVTATDANGCKGSRAYTLLVTCPSMSVSPSSLPIGTAGLTYPNTQFTQAGGTGAVGWSLSGSLPAGMSFSNGMLSGTPTQTGTFPLSVMAADAAGCSASVTPTLTISCPEIEVHPDALPSGTAGMTFPTTAFSQTGGLGTIVWSLTGTLPTGMTFSNGTLAGTPMQSGAFPFTVKATDGNGCSGGRAVTLVVSCPNIVLGPAMLRAGSVGLAYSQGLSASGGVSPYRYAVTAGALPSGLLISTAGVISGTPTAAGAYSAVITATDAAGCTGSQNYALSVVNPPVVANVAKSSPPFKLILTGSNLQSGVQVSINGVPWSQVTWKNAGKIQLTGGAALKALFPTGVAVQIRLVNPDGGEASVIWAR
jgi:photosystem II stability/assembly factor-like uncharacterized protein